VRHLAGASSFDAMGLPLVMPEKATKTAAELKLMIEDKLRAGHPECKRRDEPSNTQKRGS
jgi:hypothetical protein